MVIPKKSFLKILNWKEYVFKNMPKILNNVQNNCKRGKKTSKAMHLLFRQPFPKGCLHLVTSKKIRDGWGKIGKLFISYSLYGLEGGGSPLRSPFFSLSIFPFCTSMEISGSTGRGLQRILLQKITSRCSKKRREVFEGIFCAMDW